MKRYLVDSTGQALVEFALVLPILVLLLLCIMDGGRIFASYLELQHATRDAARFAAVRQGETLEQVTAVVNAALATIDDTKVTVAIDGPLSGTNEWVGVTLTYGVEIITPLISDLIGSPFELKTRVVMRNEG